ncbi:MAG: hypothetical protein KBT20_07290 [Bacteroidales bacterium]|nr:hypothetical protein [Candidatus Liminaster caballi]
MVKETITYVDYNGVERTEDYFFNLNKAEVIEMELSSETSLADRLTTIVNAKNRPAIVKVFKDILFKAYGEKSEDGKRFIKSDELSIAFSQTPAYEQLFMKLATNDVYAADFINKIVPEVSESEVAAAKAAAGK